MMGRRGGGSRVRLKFVAAGILVLAVSACASGPPPTEYDLTAATPPPARAVRAQFRIGQATATADLDSDHILVRESQTLATLAGALPGLSHCRRFSARGSRRAFRTPGSLAQSTVRRRMRITRSISTSALSSSTPRRKKFMSTLPPGSSRLAAGGSWRTKSSPCGRRSSQPTRPCGGGDGPGGFDRHD